uniref:Uncharacterized protein n=1 Tax=Meleagris gallopavo TaxID=9103 RepID=A0A803YPW5_MELGA
MGAPGGGRHPIMPTIMAGKMEMVFPAMYIMNRFIGICFSGPSATSQHRTFSTRISAETSCALQSSTELHRAPQKPMQLHRPY